MSQYRGDAFPDYVNEPVRGAGRVPLTAHRATELRAQKGPLKDLLATDSSLTPAAWEALMSEGACAIGGDGHLF